ncbi:MAG: hypothetical protein NZ601_07090 [candidate division WOR-3 bacterium]|nr:hypothetical protein [candidate division WOR-3 bacterium]MCX7756985.1 hypothetical protein [candidate division WOR-3 bacterium]MDW7987844.1 hypothetical protein [candidate division WOR-3 bacterium]
MKNKSFVFLLAVFCLSCYRIVLPPKLDLRGYETIGIVRFKCPDALNLEPLITQRFIAEITKDQQNLEILELGKEEELLKELKIETMGIEAYKAAATKYNVSSIFLGEVTISDIKPNVTIIPGLSYIGAQGDLEAIIVAKLIDAKTGKIIWTNSAKTRKVVGHIGFIEGKFVLDAKDPQSTYGPMVEELVKKLTRDFQKTYKYRCCRK